MKNEIKPRFRIHAKHIFATYPYNKKLRGLSKEQIIDELKDMVSGYKARLKRIIVSFETGEKVTDSKNYAHLHVLLSFDRTLDLKSENFLDLRGVHGHYKAVDKKRNSLSNVVKYVQKDGDFETWKDTSDITKMEEAPGNVAKLVEHLRGMRTPAEQKNAIQSFSTAARALYMLNKGKIDKAIQINIGNTYNNYKECQFNLPKEYLQWKKEMHSKSLLLLGASNTGKTSLAVAAFMNPLIVSDLNSLKDLNDEHDGIVFDDVIFRKLEREQKIHLLDLEQRRSFNVKFGTAAIERRVPRIFTSNLAENEFLGFIEAEEIPQELKRRYIFCLVTNDLRKEREN